MRLLYVCSDFGIKPDGIKGASVHLRAITRGLCELGHDIRLLSPHGVPGAAHPSRSLFEPSTHTPNGKRCDTRDDRMSSGRRRRASVEHPFKMLKRYLSARGYGEGVAKELRPLLYNAWICERALDALADVKPDAIVERLSLFGQVGVDLAQAFGVPLVLEVNALPAEEARRFRSLELRGLAEAMERRILTSADTIMAVSSPLAERIIAMGIRRDRVHVVPNGVDPEPFERAPSQEICRRSLGLNGAFVAGFVGSLKVWHGVDVLLAAFGRLHAEAPAARLLIIGAGPMEAALRRAACSMEMGEAVIFTGAVSHERVPELLRAMDVAVAPFRRIEDFYFSPIKLFEYMASGTCVVASKLGQIREVIDDGASGLLCRPDDIADLHAKLNRVRRSVNLRRRLAERALQVVREHYTWKHAAEKTCQIVRDAVENKRNSTDRLQYANPCTTTGAGKMHRFQPGGARHTGFTESGSKHQLETDAID